MLEIDGLHKRFGDRHALNGVSLQVDAGEIYGFVGANGAGKTTTMRIVMGAALADSGEVRWNGRPVDLGIRRTIGYMPEERGLYPRMKVRNQLRYFARLHGVTHDAHAADAWIERLGLEQYAHDDLIKLSLGNQQRVQLATALIHDPEVLVLDEPFSGLDPVAVDVMSEVLRERAAAGNPVVFSSHQLDLVERLCDRVGIIRDGVMVEQGSVDQLRQGGPRRLRIVAPGLTPGWSDAFPGITVRTQDGASIVIEIGAAAPADVDQQVLQTALASGPVHEFVPVTPSLTELFRDVVRQAS
ncbi:MAG: ATP-binding cassette domain-containing protein [Marmoricola sp.]